MRGLVALVVVGIRKDRRVKSPRCRPWADSSLEMAGFDMSTNGRFCTVHRGRGKADGRENAIARGLNDRILQSVAQQPEIAPRPDGKVDQQPTAKPTIN